MFEENLMLLVCLALTAVVAFILVNQYNGRRRPRPISVLALLALLFLAVHPAQAARTALTISSATAGGYPTALTTLTMTAADTSNQNSAVLTADQNEVVIIHNTGASAHNVTITSKADDRGRTGHISSVSVAAGAYLFLSPLKLNGWRQTDGTLYLEADHAEVKFGVIKLR